MPVIKMVSKREALAALEHDQWMAWSKTLTEKENLSDDRVERWKKLWIPYSELSETDKDFDRTWADKAYAIIQDPDLEDRKTKKSTKSAKRKLCKCKK